MTTALDQRKFLRGGVAASIALGEGLTPRPGAAALQFVGDLWEERRILRIAYAYEQATRHARPPRL